MTDLPIPKTFEEFQASRIDAHLVPGGSPTLEKTPGSKPIHVYGQTDGYGYIEDTWGYICDKEDNPNFMSYWYWVNTKKGKTSGYNVGLQKTEEALFDEIHRGEYRSHLPTHKLERFDPSKITREEVQKAIGDIMTDSQFFPGTANPVLVARYGAFIHVELGGKLFLCCKRKDPMNAYVAALKQFLVDGDGEKLTWALNAVQDAD